LACGSGSLAWLGADGGRRDRARAAVSARPLDPRSGDAMAGSGGRAEGRALVWWRRGVRVGGGGKTTMTVVWRLRRTWLQRRPAGAAVVWSCLAGGLAVARPWRVVAWPWPAEAGGGRLWFVVSSHGLAMAGRPLLLIRQRSQFGVTMVVGPEGLTGASCSVEVVLRDAPRLSGVGVAEETGSRLLP
jgi:hypothetical protein